MASDKHDPDSKPVRSFRLVKGKSAGDSGGAVVSNIAMGSIAQVVIAVAAVLAICYAAKVPLITLFVSILVTFILAPVVDGFERLRIPRSAGALLAVLLLLGCLYGLAFFSYNRAVEFVDNLPKYSENIRNATVRFRRQAEKLQQTTESVLPGAVEDSKTVRVKPQSSVSDWITSTVSGFTEVVLSASFIPFLAYFMLSWKDKTRDATVKLFEPAHRHKADVTLGRIADMLRGFLVGNFICGLFLAAVSTAVFGFMGLPYFYFIGLISGFLSLVPYLGVVLAILPPVAAGLGQLQNAEIAGIAVLVMGLHLFAVNVLFPKVIGKRLKLNPLVVTIALLMWGWIWGAMGLILAIPITGALKIVFDHVDSLRPLGDWMED